MNTAATAGSGPAVPTPSPGYLAAAAEAGLLHRLHGHPFVAGEHHDPLLEERQLLVEFCAEELLSDASWLEEVLDVAGLSAARSVVTVRAPAHIRFADPWQRHITYLRYSGRPAQDDQASSPLTIRPADPGTDTDDLIRWLAEALVGGSADHGVTAGPGAADTLAREFLDAPDRFSYVACREGRAVGHATLLCAAHDPVTARDYVDLVDVLVEESEEWRSAGTYALAAAAMAHAHRAGLPLIGHVVHPAPHIAAGQGDKIVASLVARGWAVDHVFWRRSHDKGGA
ncbi:hypothetical protein AB0F13_23660 [Streptomyces sp. NPDC026206]|uniref:hypothetical protein n=1 Tax=Streptomyces sp. NPDC026206 TaxID=3157089 RepID=UPI0033EF3FBE